jgi:hypothetical protein
MRPRLAQGLYHAIPATTAAVHRKPGDFIQYDKIMVLKQDRCLEPGLKRIRYGGDALAGAHRGNTNAIMTR